MQKVVKVLFPIRPQQLKCEYHIAFLISEWKVKHFCSFVILLIGKQQHFADFMSKLKLASSGLFPNISVDVTRAFFLLLGCMDTNIGLNIPNFH